MDAIDGFIEILPEQRRLRVTWSMEAQEDVRVFHNIDAERELTNILARELAMEIDREIIRDLRPSSGLPEITIELDDNSYWFPIDRYSEPKVNWLKEGF